MPAGWKVIQMSCRSTGVRKCSRKWWHSLTADQLRLIKNTQTTLRSFYDGDAAGRQRTALRGLEMALEESLNSKTGTDTDTEDPDSYVRLVGYKMYLANLAAANKKDFILFQLDFAERCGY